MNRVSRMLVDKVGWGVGRKTQGISDVGSRKSTKE